MAALTSTPMLPQASSLSTTARFVESINKNLRSEIDDFINTTDLVGNELVSELIKKFSNSFDEDINLSDVFQIIINSTGGFETVVKASPRSERCPSRASTVQGFDTGEKIFVNGGRSDFSLYGRRKDKNTGNSAYYVKWLGFKSEDEREHFVSKCQESEVEYYNPETDNALLRVFTGTPGVQSKLDEIIDSCETENIAFENIQIEGIFHHFKYGAPNGKYKVIGMVSTWEEQIRINQTKKLVKTPKSKNTSKSALPSSASWATKDTPESLQEEISKLTKQLEEKQKALKKQQFEKDNKIKIDKIGREYHQQITEIEAEYQKEMEKATQKYKERMRQAEIEKKEKLAELKSSD